MASENDLPLGGSFTINIKLYFIPKAEHERKYWNPEKSEPIGTARMICIATPDGLLHQLTVNMPNGSFHFGDKLTKNTAKIIISDTHSNGIPIKPHPTYIKYVPNIEMNMLGENLKVKIDANFTISDK